MADPFASGPTGRRKSEGVSDVMNKLLQNLCIKCAKEEGVRDYFHVAVIGYGAAVGPAFGGTLTGRLLVPISEIADNPARIEDRRKKVEDGAGGLVEQQVRFPIWFEPAANGATPMCAAFDQVETLLRDWVQKHPNGFPPIVMNITDGEATDGDPTARAERVKELRTSDGSVLVYNAHISSTSGSPIEFPAAETGLPDKFATLLFRMSSSITDFMLDSARKEGYTISEGARGYVFNGDLVSIIKFLDIGTRASNLR